ncbi:response regulator transcription factor [Verrucomicrobium sp. BvORR106]|uniref:response regulator transcription factor n=1 Tax=Verrucomicrobium sp. BvORR106 TaxID=1403819 RepID=UPI000691E40E|nr:response regulator transcription factor [Verrucomicrobium sp. BvORR106]
MKAGDTSLEPPQSVINAPTKSRILVVDDHPAFRFGLRELISDMAMAEVCGEAEDAATALAAFRELKPDLVLLDISLPGRDGIELTKMMKAEAPRTPILIVSMHDEAFYGLRALRAGACGYLRKDDSLDQLEDAIEHALRQDYYLSPRLKRHLIQQFLQNNGQPQESYTLQGLSDREMEVFHWLGKGLGTRQIADRLGLSVKTIETHRAHIKTKLSLESAEDMVKLAREWKLLGEKPANRMAAGRN